MYKTNSVVAVLLDYIVLLLLVFCLIIPLLPFHLAYKEIISLLFLLMSICIFGWLVKNSFLAGKEHAHSWLVISMGIFFLYIVIQLIPIPIWLVNKFSESRAEIWQSGVYGLSGYATLSLNVSATIWFLVMLFSYFCIFSLTLNLITNQSRLIAILVILFLLGIYQIVFDLIAKYLGYEYVSASEIDGHSYRLTGTFINSNNLSALINLSLAAGMTLLLMFIGFLNSKKTVFNFIIVLSIIIGQFFLIYGSIKSGSAGGFLALLLAAGIISTAFLIKRFNLLILLVFLCFLGGIAVLLIFSGSRELNIEELTTKLTLSGRPILWASVFEMWKDFPVFGIGAGAFEWTFPAYKSDHLSPLRVVNAHSGYLNLLAETGLVGMFILFAIFFLYLKNIFNLIKQNSDLQYLVGSLMIGWCAFMIHEAVENNLLLPSVAMPFFCLMAATLALVKINPNERS